jgi:CheY-like chemotaxis protein
MARSKRAKVMLVDDSEVVLMTERMTFRSLGDFEIVVARNGAEAVKLAAIEQPDLILMDIVMPEMSGIEACRLIRQSKHTEHIPVIMVTTPREEESIAGGFAAGCTHYLTKPIDKIELSKKVRDLLG